MSVNAGATTCFGKIPSRGDFVKGNGQATLLGILDTWMSQAMERFAEDPRWKIAYDQLAPLDFAFVGARSRLTVIGHWRPSSDASGRRFPFVTAGTFERDDTLAFRCAPAALGDTYAKLARIADNGVRGAEVAALLAELETVRCGEDFDQSIHRDPLGKLVRQTTLADLAGMLQLPEGSKTVARIVLAIGLLLRPILGQPTMNIDKDLRLPLPTDEIQAKRVAGLWLYLVSAFLRRTSVELQVLMERRAVQPSLYIGFNGAAPETLLAALAPESAASHLIPLLDPQWIDTQPALTQDYGVAKLASYLAQPGISLELAINTFREVFLGE